MHFSRLVAALLAGLLIPMSYADDLGAIGPTYPIGEQSALDMIMERLKEKERTGELQRLQEEAIRRSVNSVKNMKPVEGIATAVERRERLIDPTVHYTKSVTTEDGRIVVPAGTKLNPLDMITLSKTLVFFDGRDRAQREAVRKLVAKDSKRVKPILVAGSWYDMSKAWKVQVFYDQKGTLSKRFGIQAVPAVIRQRGNMLSLEEIPAKELR